MSSYHNVLDRIIAASRWLFVIVLITTSSLSVSAQTTFGRISGTVTDQAGAAVPAATVTITDPTTNFSRTVTTDDSGFYTVTNLPVGTYSVLVEMSNFKKSLRNGNSVNADSRLTVDFVLEIGQLAEVVDVTQTVGETVNTTSGEVAKLIDNQQVENLALNGRNYYQLMTLIPGAVITQEDQLDTNLATNTININGNRGVSNNLTVDGGNNNNAGSNASQINNVGVDFIQEVKLQTSNFSAEYGRNSGASINVTTKRGTNEFHGSAFEFLRNDAMDARNFFAPVKPFLRYHNYGYSIGGPLPFFNFGENDGPFFKSGKDKFFFFWGQEWKSIHRQAATVTRTLPTLAELNGDFSFRLRGFDGVVGTA
ncbi:MAG TPA: TonB-dependent receptor, partial [Pyrinomonadaceae bacterium]|nr:TonB-dependent receptor [Pyrinomonadaceae bacterium]